MTQLLVAPIEALTDPRLSYPERHVLLVLFSYRGRDSNTVWPGINAIARRAGYSDATRVSKITSSLAAHGWLKKSKVGATGRNQYFLSVPDCFKDTLSLDDSGDDTPPSKLVPETKVVGQKQVGPRDQSGQTNLVSQTNTTLVSGTKCNRTNQINKPKPLQRDSTKINSQSPAEKSQPPAGGVDQSGPVGQGELVPSEPPAENYRGCRLPRDWILPELWMLDALKLWRRDHPAACQRLAESIDSIAAKFRDYWVSQPGARGRKADWRATWRNWVRREAEHLRPGPGSHLPPGTRSTRDMSLAENLTDRSWYDK